MPLAVKPHEGDDWSFHPKWKWSKYSNPWNMYTQQLPQTRLLRTRFRLTLWGLKFGSVAQKSYWKVYGQRTHVVFAVVHRENLAIRHLFHNLRCASIIAITCSCKLPFCLHLMGIKIQNPRCPRWVGCSCWDVHGNLNLYLGRLLHFLKLKLRDFGGIPLQSPHFMVTSPVWSLYLQHRWARALHQRSDVTWCHPSHIWVTGEGMHSEPNDFSVFFRASETIGFFENTLKNWSILDPSNHEMYLASNDILAIPWVTLWHLFQRGVPIRTIPSTSETRTLAARPF